MKRGKDCAVADTREQNWVSEPLFRLITWVFILICGICAVSAQDLALENDSMPDTGVKAESGSQDPSTSEKRVPISSAAKPSDSLPSSSNEWWDKENNFRRPELKIDREQSASHFPKTWQNTTSEEKFHWKPALIQSGIFLAIQHGFRMTQEKTTSRLGGPFFKDWGNSIKVRGWRDGDGTFTNYVAHPMQGSLTGRIFVNNSDNAKKQEFGRSKAYWMSRLKALGWTTAWSLQFEFGPLSEASIGNVGSFKKDGYWTGAYVDLVITPTVGTAVLIGEDAIDKYVLTNWLERKRGGKVTTKIKLFRSLLTPTTTFANILRWKVPWKRDDRPN